MSIAVNPEVFRRMLRERCMTAEELRQALGLSYSTMAKLNHGGTVSDKVFRDVVREIQRRPVVPVAQQLIVARPEQGEEVGA